MSAILIFLAVLAGVAGWWLSRQRLLSKPWLETGTAGHFADPEETALRAAKLGLGVFLAVVGALFALFISAYSMRMALPDWQAPPLPRLLWINTGSLLLGSVALQAAVHAVRNGEVGAARLALAAGGAATLTFLVGQAMAWQELAAGGYLVDTNPANSFFYLLTAMHGLHIAGGLVALGRTTAMAWRGEPAGRLRLSVELCAIYWHFLLLVWLVLLAVLGGWAQGFLGVSHHLPG